MKPKFDGKYCTSQNYWCAVLNPFDCTKRYEVDYGGWNGGKFKTFWFFRNALKFAQSCKEDFVSIQDEKNLTSLTLKEETYVISNAARESG